LPQCCCSVSGLYGAARFNESGELSHAAGGAVLTGGFTSLAHGAVPEQRKWIGFLVNSACVVVDKWLALSQGEPWENSSQRLTWGRISWAQRLALPPPTLLCLSQW
jgi:hypothetical protein